MTKNEKGLIKRALGNALEAKAIAVVYSRSTDLVPEKNRAEAKATFLADYYQALGKISALSMLLSPAEYQEVQDNTINCASYYKQQLQEGNYVREYRYWFEDEEEEIPF